MSDDPTQTPIWMDNLDKALSVTAKLRIEADIAALKVLEGGDVYIMGDLTTEIWDAHGRSVTRTFMGEDGKLHREAIDPDEFYA